MDVIFKKSLSMERIKRIATQLEECKKFIEFQQDTHYRLAVLLLDNLIELLMYHVVCNEFQYDDYFIKLHKWIDNTPASDEEKRKIRSELKYELIPTKQRVAVDRYFDEKLKFLSSHRDYISPQTARVLSRLHVYRNEIYHRDTVRLESIRTAALILFDIACDLISDLKLSSCGYNSDDDLSWMAKYTEIKMDFDIQKKVAKYYRDSFSLDLTEIRHSLIEHLNDRFSQFMERLKFINENTRPNDSLDVTLKSVQFWVEDRTRSPHSRDSGFQRFTPKYTLDWVNSLKDQVSSMGPNMDKVDLFARFSDIEEAFEPVESQVCEVNEALDSAIQMAIDIARGK